MKPRQYISMHLTEAFLGFVDDYDKRRLLTRAASMSGPLRSSTIFR